MDVLLTGHHVASPVLKVCVCMLGIGGDYCTLVAAAHWWLLHLCLPSALRLPAWPGCVRPQRPLLLQIAVSLVTSCQHDLLNMHDFEEMVSWRFRPVPMQAAGHCCLQPAPTLHAWPAWAASMLATQLAACLRSTMLPCFCDSQVQYLRQDVPRWPKRALQDLLTDALR